MQHVGNYMHVRETNKSRQITARGRSTRKEILPPSTTESGEKGTRGLQPSRYQDRRRSRRKRLVRLHALLLGTSRAGQRTKPLSCDSPSTSPTSPVEQPQFSVGLMLT